MLGLAREGCHPSENSVLLAGESLAGENLAENLAGQLSR